LEMNVNWWQCGRCCAFLLVSLASGCQTFPLPRPIVVLVRDAETQAPLSEVELQVVYPVNSPPVTADQRVGATTVDGMAALPIVPCGDRSVLVKATRPGYLPEDAALTAAFLRSIEPAHWWNATDQRPNFAIDMYSQPQFTVELIVPNGYRGLITADMQIDEQAASNGQRLFRYAVPASGNVTMQGPPALRRIFLTDVHARYADGTPLDAEMSWEKVGFRWLKRHGHGAIFVVGTQTEFDGYCRDLKFDNVAGSPSGAARTKRHGRASRQHGEVPEPAP
jgi:hypothetical protein